MDTEKIKSIMKMFEESQISKMDLNRWGFAYHIRKRNRTR